MKSNYGKTKEDRIEFFFTHYSIGERQIFIGKQLYCLRFQEMCHVSCKRNQLLLKCWNNTTVSSSDISSVFSNANIIYDAKLKISFNSTHSMWFIWRNSAIHMNRCWLRCKRCLHGRDNEISDQVIVKNNFIVQKLILAEQLKILSISQYSNYIIYIYA